MTDLKVDIGALKDYGSLFESFGSSNVGQTGDQARSYCGVTSDMDGLLDVIAPAIRSVADAFGNHYDDIAQVVTKTGTALVATAGDYGKVDHAVAVAMDRKAVSVGEGTDNPMGSGGGWTETYGHGIPREAESDPAEEIRSSMDADVRAIDWVFNKFTGHHITEPIDSIVGNWTTLTARGSAWGDVSDTLRGHGDDVIGNVAVIDGVWDGVAATTFNAYGTRLGNGLLAEAEIPLGIQAALDKLASEWRNLYEQCVDLLEEVIHDVEIAAAALAAGWWCGIGEAVAAKKCQEALVAFYRAYKIVKLVQHVIQAANLAVKGFEKLVDAFDLVTHVPEAIEGQIGELKDLMAELGAIPDHLDNLSHLGDTPTSPYGGPNAPGIS